MKTDKPTLPTDNGESATTPDPANLILECDYRDQDFEYWPRPSELDLARLAAQLARVERLDPKQLVAAAWELYWESCRRLQADHRAVRAFHEHLERLVDEPEDTAGALPAGVPMPKKYPVTHRQIEGLLLPQQKGRTAERASLIREYFFAQLARGCLVLRPQVGLMTYWEMEPDLLEQLRQKLKDDVAKHFEKYRQTNFDAEAYARFAKSFLTWRQRYVAAKKAAAARKRWAREEAKRHSANSQTEPEESNAPKRNSQKSL